MPAEFTNLFQSEYRLFKIPETRFATTYPNSCSSGCLLKTDLYDERNEHLYVKLPHRARNNSWGMESLNEIICSRLGLQLGLSVLQYEPCLVDLMNGDDPCFGCCSVSYAEGNVIPLTAVDLCDSACGEFSTSGQTLRSLGYSDLVDLFIAWDYLIGGTDRHANNIEFLLYPDGAIVPAPIFDNGKSLLSTYGRFPKGWDLEQTTNNFLTYQKMTKTFTSIHSPVHMVPLADVDWRGIQQGIEDKLTTEQWQLISQFVEHNYQVLQSKGLVI